MAKLLTVAKLCDNKWFRPN